MGYRKVSTLEHLWYVFKNRIKRRYHKWCLRNAIAYHGYAVCSYHASTNSFIVKSKLTGWKYDAYVDLNGNIVFKAIAPHVFTTPANK